MSHGGQSRSEVVAPRSKFYQGPFGRICADLEPYFPNKLKGNPKKEKDPQALEDLMLKVAASMVEKDDDAAGESDIPAGYTYFGQFVDHDITFDPASSLMRINDPAGLFNHRTPRLDLDNVYGRGPEDSPYLYQRGDKAKLLIGQIEKDKYPDLPRNSETVALIGDMRNDENSIVSQLQLAFLLAHNRLVDIARKKKKPDPFEAARTTLRWLYQWVVWHDFLKRVCDPATREAALVLRDHGGGSKSMELGFKHVYNWKHHPFIPVEFSVAAYRFGHSLVRNSYQTNVEVRGFGNFAPIFDMSGTPDDPDSRKDLSGFRRMQPDNIIQWDWFLQMESSSGPFPQLARKIDTKMSKALTTLRDEEEPLNKLAFRNLMRGLKFELPRGPEVARKYCLPTVKADAHALWYYILKEAEDGGGNHLGPLGSLIVCATFAGLLKGDPCSWVNVKPCWTPDDDDLLSSEDEITGKPFNQDGDNSAWGLPAIIRLSGLAVDGSGIDRVRKNGPHP
ncbi:peroxidase family protein [Fulvimarina sp. MAC3]|uniref:peroxidase family protein n=1 Tax=Fulvimarina sp. MAC3 TaxID=3148887 RepID=UPI0031FBB391